MGKRRGHGEGSIYQTADGSWRGAVDLGWQDGKRVRRYLSGPTRVAVAGKVRTLQHAVETGRTPAKGVTVEQHLLRWLTESLPDRVAPNAIASYGSVVRVHLIPALGKKKLSALTPADVERLLNAKLAEGLSVSTVRRIRSVLGQALRQAERWDLVVRNVALLTDAPKAADDDEARSLTLAESKQLLAAARGTRMEVPVTLLLALGLRRGELLGLRWADVDLDAGVLRVKRALGQVNGKATIVDLKTTKSRRTLNLVPPVLAALRQHKALGLPGEHVFAATNGEPWHPRNFSRDFARLVTAAELDPEEVHTHTCRHTANTLMLAAGVPVQAVMAILGHATARMTLETYTHVDQPVRQAAAEALGGVLFAEADADVAAVEAEAV